MSQTIEVSSFLSSLGVNTHLNYNTTAYNNLSAVESAMRYLGLNTMRDLGGQTWTSAYDTAAKDGFKFDFIAPEGSLLQNPTSLASWANTFVTNHPGSIVSIEGPNEINFNPVSWGGLTGYAGGVAYEQALYNALNSYPSLANIPSLNLSLGVDTLAGYSPVGNMSAMADRGNAHIYVPFGAQPYASFTQQLGWAQSVTPGEAMSVTETGYGSNPSDSGLGGDEATQAKLTLNLVLDAAKAGVASTFLYELVDDPVSGAQFSSFGLFRSDWTAKPAATALHNLTTILTTNASGAAALAAAPSYTVSGLDNYNASLTFHESNGTYDIVVWREPQIWNSTTHTEVAANTETATIQLGQAVSGYSVYDPLTGTTAIASGGATSTISVQVTDHPIIIELHGDGSSSGATPSTPTVQNGTAGADTLTGADGQSNAIYGGDGADSIVGGSGFNQVNGNKGDDVIVGHSTVGDWLSGGQGNDMIDATASTGHNIINGNLGADTVFGGAGGDTLRGGQGDDVIHAGTGADWISGDLGNNTIFGGAGNDFFHASAGHDSVSGWHAGDHVLVDAGVTFTTTQVGADVHITFSTGGEMDLLNTQVNSLQAAWIAQV